MANDLLNVGVIGAGIWGAQHAHVFSTLPNTRLVGVCDLDGERAGALAAGHEVTSVFTDHRDMLAADGIDAVSVATPDFTHTPIILDALAADKHVLSEKPLATTVEEAEQVRQAAEHSDRVVMVDFHNRVSPVIAAARDDIAAGVIGKPIHLSGRLSNTTFVPLQMLSWSSRSSALWFLGSHLVDALRYLLADNVVRVFAMKGEGLLQSRGVNTQDVHLSMLEFAGGAIGTIENSWVLAPDNPQVFDLGSSIVGAGGQLQLNPSHNGAYQQISGEGVRYRDLFGLAPAGPGRIGGFIAEAIARFVDSVMLGEPVLASVEDGLKVTRILAAIEKSADTGQPVDVGP